MEAVAERKAGRPKGSLNKPKAVALEVVASPPEEEVGGEEGEATEEVEPPRR